MKVHKETIRKYWKYKSPENGYRELTYVSSQGIDTGVQCTNEISFEFEAAFEPITNWTYILSNKDTSSGNWMIFGYEDGSNGFTWHYLSTMRSTGIYPTAGRYYKFSSDFSTSDKKYYIDDVLKITVSDGTTRTLAGNFIFPVKNTIGKYLKLFDKNKNIIRNFIPCEKLSDNTLGWYDTVNNQFYTAEETTGGEYIIEEGTSSDYDYYTDIDVLSTPARVSIHTSNIPKDIVNISATATTTIELNAGNEYYVEIVGGGGRGSYGQAGYWQERYGGGSGSRFSANLSVSSGNHTMVLVCGGGIGSPSTLTIDDVLVATAGGGGTPSAGVVSYDISGVSGIEFSDIVAKNGNGGNRTFDVGGAYTGNAASVASQGQYGQGAGSGNGYGEDYNRRIGWTYLQALKYKITETILYALNK